MSEPAKVFLSKLLLNPGNRDVQRGVANCHALHQTIMRGFPAVASDAPRKALKVLYRPELEARTGALAVLVQSCAEPDWAPLHGDWTAVLANSAEAANVKRVDEAFARLAAGDRLRFRLRANPTKRLIKTLPDGSANRGGGQRVQLFREEDQLAWLTRKGASGGFEVIDARADPGDALGPKQTGGQARGESMLTFGVAVFNGVLRVTDPVRLRETLIAGIGSGKAYGFGLLSVAPVR